MVQNGVSTEPALGLFCEKRSIKFNAMLAHQNLTWSAPG